MPGVVTAVGLIVTNLEMPSRAASLLLMGLLVAVAGLSAGWRGGGGWAGAAATAEDVAPWPLRPWSCSRGAGALLAVMTDLASGQGRLYC